MTVELKPEAERLVQEEIRRGHFHSVGEVIVQGVYALREKSQVEQATAASPSGMVIHLVTGTGKSKQFEAGLREEIVGAKQYPTEVLGNMLASLLPVMDVDVSDLAIECLGLHWRILFRHTLRFGNELCRKN